MLTIYFIIAALTFIVLGLVRELRNKYYEETDWVVVTLVSLAWPLTLSVLFLMCLAYVITWVAQTIKGNLT